MCTRWAYVNQQAFRMGIITAGANMLWHRFPLHVRSRDRNARPCGSPQTAGECARHTHWIHNAHKHAGSPCVAALRSGRQSSSWRAQQLKASMERAMKAVQQLLLQLRACSTVQGP